MSKVELMNWVKSAHKGQSMVYYRGHIAYDQTERDLKGITKQAVNAMVLCRIVNNLVEQGIITVTHQAIGPIKEGSPYRAFAYRAIKVVQ